MGRTALLVPLGFIVATIAGALVGCETKTDQEAPKPCRKARVTATVTDNTNLLGSVQLFILLDGKGTNACEKGKLSCTRDIPVSGNSVPVVITDVTLKDYEYGRGTISIPTSQEKIGKATVDAACIE